MNSEKCCLPGCDSIRRNVMLHKFPRSEKRLQKWVTAINSTSLNTLTLLDLRKLFVCHKHFEARCLSKKGRLRGIAYPTLISPEEVSRGKPLTPHEEPQCFNPSLEHNYSKNEHDDHTYSRTWVNCELSGQIPPPTIGPIKHV